MHDSFKALLPMIIPEGVSDYFALSNHKKDATGIHIYLGSSVKVGELLGIYFG